MKLILVLIKREGLFIRLIRILDLQIMKRKDLWELILNQDLDLILRKVLVESGRLWIREVIILDLDNIVRFLSLEYMKEKMESCNIM